MMMAENDSNEVSVDPNVIKEGETAIFKKGEVLKAIKLVPDKQVVFERLRFKVNRAFGCTYGTSYRVVDNLLVKVDPDEYLEVNNGTNTAAGVDNRSLNDLKGGSQTLDRDEIVKMKESGASGKEIVQSLVDNSSSFTAKTVFSQSKYLKKKQKKHCAIIQILRSTSRLICQLYQEREPSKISSMHMESLSQLLCLSNIRSGSKVVLVETCSGVVLGSILERMGTQGSVVNLHQGGETAPNLFAVQHLNMKDEQWNMLHSLPLHLLSPALTCKDEDINKLLEVQQSEGTRQFWKKLGRFWRVKGILLGEDEEEEEQCGGDNKEKVEKEMLPPTRKRKYGRDKELTREERLAIRLERRKKRKNHQLEAINLLRSRDMDCLIVACRMHPTPIVLMLLETLAPSRPFAVYCENREPLMELFVSLSTSDKAINIHLTDTFMRQYQVLPERTHPLVTMPGNRGYVLSGIKVV